ncbi:uncharacterized protein LOC115677555 [Syzygium oleosum]|uniref:uncharacterized protein LOC115677555 n=1 Tax=Syzygium oleosum TaxID=219896 RepID=UPI0011D27225|nr:uncharacterized protein LOC115677555 [Syzygium oleosum]
MNNPPTRFGIPMHSENLAIEYPIGNNQAWIKRTIIVYVDVGLPELQPNKYMAWCFKDELDEFGPVRSFDAPFDGVGDWDPSAVPPPDGELTSTETRPVSVPTPAPIPPPEPMGPEPVEVEPDLEPKESHQGAGPMEPEVKHELTEEFEDPEVEDEEPEEEFEEEPEEEEPEEDQPIEVPSESGSEGNPIEIEADFESEYEWADHGEPDTDSRGTDPEWSPAGSRRG